MTSYVLSLAAGSLTSLSPCVLPVLPLIVGSAAQRNKLAPVAMAAGLTGSFTLVGLLVAGLGTAVTADQDRLRAAGVIALGLMGLLLLIRPWQDWLSARLTPLASRGLAASSNTGDGLLGHVASGALLGAVWSPCVGPTLGGAIALASQTHSIARAAITMVLFGLGASAPLLLIAYGLRGAILKQRSSLLRAGDAGKKILGASLLLIAVLVATGLDKRVEALAVGVLPEAWINFTTSL